MKRIIIFTVLCALLSAQTIKMFEKSKSGSTAFCEVPGY